MIWAIIWDNGKVLFKGYVLGQNEIFCAHRKIWIYRICAFGILSCILFEFNMFLSCGIWNVTYLRHHFGTVDFDADVEEEEEAEPEEAAPPKY